MNPKLGKISLESGGEVFKYQPEELVFGPRIRSTIKGESTKEKGVAFLAKTELPARTVDLSTVNLTELVNGMLTRALKDSKQFFSLLSITSHSSFAFHKFSVVIYNISNLKIMDATKFPTRYCYCLNNQTNDLSDFTALLVDIIGNSTSYLMEIFKSTSILSVSQSTESDCIYICVMTGKTGRNLSDFWEMVEKSPVINYTFTSNVSGVLGCPQPLLQDKDLMTLPLTLSLQKINPCVMELCRFYQQCLCVSQKQYSRKDTMRFCTEYYSWFLRNATYICQRVTRMAHSHTLKQKCLSNICTSV
ncbi:HERV-H LTR-associating protein 1 [Sarcophilus harrisii]